MPIVESSTVIDAPPEALFTLSQDYYRRLEWDPFVKGIKFLNEAREAAPGVRVWVQAKTGLTMTAEYVTVQPPSHVAVKMVNGPFFFEQFAGAWRFERQPPGQSVRDWHGRAGAKEVPPPGQTRVHFRYHFKTRWPLLRPVLDPMIEFMFARDIKARLRGLKEFAEAEQHTLT